MKNGCTQFFAAITHLRITNRKPSDDVRELKILAKWTSDIVLPVRLSRAPTAFMSQKGLRAGEPATGPDAPVDGSSIHDVDRNRRSPGGDPSSDSSGCENVRAARKRRRVEAARDPVEQVRSPLLALGDVPLIAKSTRPATRSRSRPAT